MKWTKKRIESLVYREVYYFNYSQWLLHLAIKVKKTFEDTKGQIRRRNSKETIQLGDDCIVFENFTLSIGDLMVANWVYCRRVSEARKRIFATIKSTIDTVKFSNKYSYLHSNVIVCIATLLTRWRNISGNRLKFQKYPVMIFQPWNWYLENYSIVQSQTRNIKQLH